MMKRAASYFLAAILVLLTVSANLTPVQAFTPIQNERETFLPRGIAVSATCPYGTGATTNNGCSGANQNGSFQNANLVNTAQQGGQNSVLPQHAVVSNGVVPFNMPAVDYPVGYDKTLTLKDPRTINDGVCQWASTFLDCSSTGGGVVNEVLNGYDFSGTTIGQAAVGIYAPNNHVSSGSTLTITNSKLALLPSAGVLEVGGNFNNVVFKNNVCDGASANSGSDFCLPSASTGSGTWDIEYNAFTNQGVGRIAGGQQNIIFIAKYNFIQGLNDLATSNHGELMLRNCTGSRQNCTGSDDYEGNFIIWNPPSTSGLNNATIFPGDGGSDGVALSSVTFNNNVTVTNINGSTTVIDQAMFNARLSTMGVVTMNNNWTDASGANGCSISGVKSGGNSVTAQQSGTVITITGLSSSFNNSPIEKGWQFWRSGVVVATILSMGTSTGQTGTVNVDTSATIGSDSNWTLVPGYTSFAASGNYLLNDPSHTGSPTAMGTFSVAQMVPANCF